jgi:hypothetical protein
MLAHFRRYEYEKVKRRDAGGLRVCSCSFRRRRLAFSPGQSLSHTTARDAGASSALRRRCCARVDDPCGCQADERVRVRARVFVLACPGSGRVFRCGAAVIRWFASLVSSLETQQHRLCIWPRIHAHLGPDAAYINSALGVAADVQNMPCSSKSADHASHGSQMASALQ